MVEDADGKIDTEGFEAELEEMLQNQQTDILDPLPYIIIKL